MLDQKWTGHGRPEDVTLHRAALLATDGWSFPRQLLFNVEQPLSDSRSADFRDPRGDNRCATLNNDFFTVTQAITEGG
jgi:hypothetical protein